MTRMCSQDELEKLGSVVAEASRTATWIRNWEINFRLDRRFGYRRSHYGKEYVALVGGIGFASVLCCGQEYSRYHSVYQDHSNVNLLNLISHPSRVSCEIVAVPGRADGHTKPTQDLLYCQGFPKDARQSEKLRRHRAR